MRTFRGSVLAALMASMLVSLIGCGSSTTASSPAASPSGFVDQEALQREAMKTLKKKGKGVTKLKPITN
ncbi:hypothetical protein ACYOEI_01820 [Singulisphaera rosea]